ncbi:FMN-binding protein [Poseidonocella sp. HB161398]|uniref:FMN-binding protein n=1 Tax=Poseidonocella sp. HB161398 TaxID=2320855 RepID=UPI0011083A3A|nr:FMN-binding protein [Poseidonocella sp. HB161398]
MADLNPIRAWQRLLAQPNDSRGKTVLVAVLTALFCTLLVSGATVVLRPVQTANRAAETQARLEALLAAIPGMSEILEASEDAVLGTVVVDLDRGRAAQGITPGTLETALADTANWTALSPEEDVAGIGSRPDFAQIYLLREGGAVALMILPISGAGFNGAIDAMLAVNGDMETIAGIAILSQSETPGLGARIEEPAWQASFAGTRWQDASGEMRFEVARGRAASEFEVDGITGATRTSSAMERIVRFWLGPKGYGPLIAAVKRGEF